jgi:acyl-CoA reductase-like NAD-dependent aldehyde dehydrogenase
MKMVINGKLVDASDKQTIDVINPATGELVDSVPSATKEDVELAVAKAVEGQKVWAQVPVSDRVDILYRFLDLVENQKEALAQLLCAETGKPINEARGELSGVPTAFRSFCEKAKHMYGEVVPAGTEPGQAKNILFTKREPIGVIACVIPFNFPVDLFNQKVPPALLAGNAAILKPSTDNPLTLCRLTELLVQAGVPDGAIEIVTGRGSSVGAWLCSDPRVRAISLTGSTEVGIETARNAAEHLTHVALELGGNDAFIVLEDADMDLVIDEMVAGRMLNAGQVCCASKRFIVHKSLADEFTKRSVERLSQLKMGLPSDEDTQLGCLISEKAAIGVMEQIQRTVDQGGKVVLGGTRNGAFVSPTVIANVPKTADVASDMEIFGPVVPVISFETEEEAIEIANGSIYGLCGCVFTKDMKAALRVCNALECGGTIINGASLFRSYEMPFGGYKYSGIGTEGVLTTFDEMTMTKSIVLKNIL